MALFLLVLELEGYKIFYINIIPLRVNHVVRSIYIDPTLYVGILRQAGLQRNTTRLILKIRPEGADDMTAYSGC